ncbi:FKBP-type peptidyl-prolyl cis-trans isomerase [Colwelliaceae bacterium 6471]
MSKVIILVVIFGLITFYFYRANINKANAVQNIKIGEEFLAENKSNEGVLATDSGLQYQVLQHGDGGQHPSASDQVTVHYHGTLIDGTVFDSSVERGEPIAFGLNQVISGWTEGLQLMVAGDKFRFFIPAHLGYGNNSAGKIPAGSLLIFDVELIDIQ